ncbi:hypothetical protein Ahy_B01g053443 isoform A [Arachis hypogaea]|uniref:Uncharacterized protein n=1 Tax=Arachis hypogaea TaxID=3818 RepID=A0A445ARU5_ARAHY|nr:hypothetical protein Ahy_B01g053443 isoform A [Arachis hypogaea]
MEKKLTLLQTVATAGVFSAISFWYGFMFGRESSRKELSQLIEDLRNGNPSSSCSVSISSGNWLYLPESWGPLVPHSFFPMASAAAAKDAFIYCIRKKLCCVTYHDNTAQVISESVMEALHVVRVNLEGSPSFQHRHGITP